MAPAMHRAIPSLARCGEATDGIKGVVTPPKRIYLLGIPQYHGYIVVLIGIYNDVCIYNYTMGYDADVMENTMGYIHTYIYIYVHTYVYIYVCIYIYEGLQGMFVALQTPLHFHEKKHPI